MVDTAPQPAPPAIDARNFSVREGDRTMLENVNMTVESGLITAIIGPAGSGKSLFLRCVNRLLDLDATIKTTGTLAVFGDNIYAGRTDVILLRRRVGMLFNHPTLPVAGIFDNIAMAPRMAGVGDKARLVAIVERCLRRVGLWELAQNRLAEPAAALPREQQQRLCLARVLATDPRLILLDEPTADMDPPSVSRMEDLICDLARDYTVLLAAQTPQQASHVADQTAFFLNGRLVEMGPTDQILTCPKDKQTEAYVSGRYA